MNPSVIRTVQYREAVSAANGATVSIGSPGQNEAWFVFYLGVERSAAVAAPVMHVLRFVQPDGGTPGPTIALIGDGGSIAPFTGTVPFLRARDFWVWPLHFVQLFTNVVYADGGVFTMRMHFIPVALAGPPTPGLPTLGSSGAPGAPAEVYG